MSDSVTPNLGLTQPEVGSSTDTWGGKLNADLAILDGIFTATGTTPISAIIKSDTKFVDATTTTKIVKFNLTGINTTTARTVTFLDADMTLVGTSNAQTLSSKTIAATGFIMAGQATGTTQILAATTASGVLTMPAGIGTFFAGQVTTTVTGEVTIGSTLIPFDDTIPQSTEGDQFMSLAITPKSAASTLVVDVVANLSNLQASTGMAVALFKDSDTDALAVAYDEIAVANGLTSISLCHIMAAGTTTSITFKVRAGGAASVTTFNGQAGVRFFGGKLSSRITIQEIL